MCVAAHGARMRDGFATPGQMPEWFTETDLDVYVESLERGGFSGPLSSTATSRETGATTGARPKDEPVEVPAIFIGGEHDVGTWWGAEAIARPPGDSELARQPRIEGRRSLGAAGTCDREQSDHPRVSERASVNATGAPGRKPAMRFERTCCWGEQGEAEQRDTERNGSRSWCLAVSRCVAWSAKFAPRFARRLSSVTRRISMPGKANVIQKARSRPQPGLGGRLSDSGDPLP